jgi:hypothetical protein
MLAGRARLIRAEFNEDSLLDIHDYLKNPILFDGDIKLIRYTLEENYQDADGSLTEDDKRLYDEIQSTLGKLDKHRKDHDNKKNVSDESSKEQASEMDCRDLPRLPIEVLSHIFSFFPYNKRLRARLVDKQVKYEIDNWIPLNESVIFPKRLVELSGFVQTNINKKRERTAANNSLGKVITLLGDMTAEDKKSVVNKITEYTFDENEVRISIDPALRYMGPKPSSLKGCVHLGQAVILTMVIMEIEYYLGVGLLTFRHYENNEIRNMDLAMNLAVDVAVSCLALIPLWYHLFSAGSLLKGYRAGRNAHTLFNTMNAARSNEQSAEEESHPLLKLG